MVLANNSKNHANTSRVRRALYEKMELLGLVAAILAYFITTKKQNRTLFGFPCKAAFGSLEGERFRASATINGTHFPVAIVVNSEFTYVMSSSLSFTDFILPLKNECLVAKKCRSFIGYQVIIESNDWQVEHYFNSLVVSKSVAKKIQKYSGYAIGQYFV